MILIMTVTALLPLNRQCLVPKPVEAFRLMNMWPYDVHCGDKFTMALVKSEKPPLSLGDEGEIEEFEEFAGSSEEFTLGTNASAGVRDGDGDHAGVGVASSGGLAVDALRAFTPRCAVPLSEPWFHQQVHFNCN